MMNGLLRFDEDNACEVKDVGGLLYVVEMAGLTIAHFGHIGQNELTQDQLDALGDIDIAITQLANSYSRMGIENKKGFHLMDQVRPRLIIPTRSDMETVEHAVARWESYYADSPVNIARSDLSDGTRFLVMGDGTDSSLGLAYKGIFSLPDW